MPDDPAERRWSSAKVIEALADVMVRRECRSIFARTTAPSSSPAICANGLRNGDENAYIEPGSPWENGYCESFNSKLRDEFLNGEIFYSMKEVRVLAERWQFITTLSGLTRRWDIDHQRHSLGGEQLGVWRSGNRYALPTSPHPRLRLSINNDSRATLTIKLVQKIG